MAIHLDEGIFTIFFTRLCRRQDTGDCLSRRAGQKGKKEQKGGHSYFSRVAKAQSGHFTYSLDLLPQVPNEYCEPSYTAMPYTIERAEGNGDTFSVPGRAGQGGWTEHLRRFAPTGW